MDYFASLSTQILLYVPISIAVAYLAIHYLVYSRRVAQWKRSNIPFLKPSFLIGHKYFLNLTKHSPLVSLDRIYRENKDKDVVGFFMTTMPMILIRKPALIKQIFAKNSDKTFETGFIGCRSDEVAQNMVSLSADKELWKSGRKALSPMFTTFRLSGEAFSKISAQIGPMWAHLEEAHRTGRPVDAQLTSFNFMVDSISRSVFSLDSNSHKAPGELHKLLTDVHEAGVMRMIRIYAQMQFPGAQLFEPLKLVGEKHKTLMKNIIQQKIQHKIEQPSDDNDIVDMMMRLKHGEKANGQGSDIDITNQLIGYGFTAAIPGAVYFNESSLAANAMHLLSLHPEHQERIRNEVTEVMEMNKTSEFTYEVVRNLRFTEQCILETVRLYPNVPFLTRICSEDFQVPGTDYFIKKGERIVVDPYSIHRDPEYFKNPDQFDPERFSPENKNAFSPESYLSFGIGPRKCPGDKLGLLRIATVIASLLHRFEIKPRSHLKQMEATDFNPKIFHVNTADMLVDVVPVAVKAQ